MITNKIVLIKSVKLSRERKKKINLGIYRYLIAVYFWKAVDLFRKLDQIVMSINNLNSPKGRL